MAGVVSSPFISTYSFSEEPSDSLGAWQASNNVVACGIRSQHKETLSFCKGKVNQKNYPGASSPDPNQYSKMDRVTAPPPHAKPPFCLKHLNKSIFWRMNPGKDQPRPLGGSWHQQRQWKNRMQRCSKCVRRCTGLSVVRHHR